MGSMRFYLLFLLYLHTYIPWVNGSFGLKESSAASNIKTSEFSARISGKDLDDMEWQDDNNKENSECQISLWARPIEGYPTKEITEMHWAIHFEWDDQVSTYEANEIDGYIIPKWHSGRPKTNSKKWEGKKTQDWGTYTLSPKQVNQAAKNNRLNGFKYFMGYINCQHWVSVLTLDLGIKKPQETYAEGSPFWAIFATAARATQGSKDAVYTLAASLLKDAITVDANLEGKDAIALAKYMLKAKLDVAESMDLLQKDFPAIKEYLYKTDLSYLAILAAAAIAIDPY